MRTLEWFIAVVKKHAWIWKTAKTPRGRTCCVPGWAAYSVVSGVTAAWRWGLATQRLACLFFYSLLLRHLFLLSDWSIRMLNPGRQFFEVHRLEGILLLGLTSGFDVLWKNPGIFSSLAVSYCSWIKLLLVCLCEACSCVLCSCAVSYWQQLHGKIQLLVVLMGAHLCSCSLIPVAVMLPLAWLHCSSTSVCAQT